MCVLDRLVQSSDDLAGSTQVVGVLADDLLVDLVRLGVDEAQLVEVDLVVRQVIAGDGDPGVGKCCVDADDSEALPQTPCPSKYCFGFITFSKCVSTS